MSHTPYATFGNISIDDLVFEDGTTMWKVPGGNSVYSALGMALWGERPTVIAPVGPEYPREKLGDRIDLSRCRPLQRTLRNWGLYEEDGCRTFLFRRSTRNWLDFSPTLDDIADFGCDYAHFAPLRWELTTAFVEALRAAGTRIISIDPDDRYLNELTPEALARQLRQVNLFLPSRQDAEALMPGKTPLEVMKALRDIAPEIDMIAVKLGDSGVMFHAAGASDYVTMPSVADVVIDATGAGDAFSGGALVGFGRTGSALEAALWGSVSASFAVAEQGPYGLVAADRAVAEQRLERLRGCVDIKQF